MATAREVLGHAASQIGYTENPPGTNRTKYAAEAGHANGQPWCATFVVAMMRRAGIKLPSESASVYYMRIGFKQAKRHYATPQVGDVVFYSFSHAGIVESFTDTTVTAIEGNTSPGVAGSQSNGGGVYRRVRDRSLVVGYGRPAYTIPAPPSAPTVVTPMYNPPIVMPNIVASLKAPSGGVWLLGLHGEIYAFECPDYGAPNRHPEYWTATQLAARLEPFNGGYTVIDSIGQRYNYPAS